MATEHFAPLPKDDAQWAKLEELRSRIQADTTLTAEQKDWCNTGTLTRYLEARGWSVGKADKMLRATLQWRFLEYRPMDILLADVAEIAATGTAYVNGFDKQNRPVVYIRSRREKDGDASQKYKFFMHVLEDAISKMDASLGVSKTTWFIDFANWGSGQTSAKFCLDVLSALQNHYPERLGSCFIVNAPWVFSALWRILTAFMDSRTKEKVQFITGKPEAKLEKLATVIDISNLEKDFGGGLDFEWSFESYWQPRIDAQLAARAAAAPLPALVRIFKHVRTPSKIAEDYDAAIAAGELPIVPPPPSGADEFVPDDAFLTQ
eukprot:TRINITY_DN2875_c0_g1_i1.p2 TRINITY_DN2875_c0_g1~~TRINITY_DN2875_c0_g1_i1.p2  ORF type:complete len:335 (-),score=55.23 TRINITY_DN2875_c0_g1_i1:1163-2122(-)